MHVIRSKSVQSISFEEVERDFIMAIENGGTDIKVIVRVRPPLRRECYQDSECLVHMSPDDDKLVELKIPEISTYHSLRNRTLSTKRTGEEGEEKKRYIFDRCVWSFNPQDVHHRNNAEIYDSLGDSLINDLFQGFNMCLLAYGQTGSGKTHTLIGSKHEEGIFPLLVRDILHCKKKLVPEYINCDVRMSYMEIYNEQVQDLLGEQEEINKCRVREHPKQGAYVENLSERRIEQFKDFMENLNRGNRVRTTASTSMNDESSRSHAIITISLIQTKFCQSNSSDSDGDIIGDPTEKMVSDIKLVDLAGSERLKKTQTFGNQDRMKEGVSINKSLAVLGRCINLLSENCSIKLHKLNLVPFRDSTLSYILKENLSGNSKSYMIFCISPLDFDETLQTLNYAKQVKNIKTSAKANRVKLTDKQFDVQEIGQAEISLIDHLKNEIDSLTGKLLTLDLQGQVKQPSEGVTSDEGKVYKLFSYLEKETCRVKFENKLLKSKFLQKDAEARELQNHIKYIEHYLSLMCRKELNEEDALNNANLKRQLLEECEEKLLDINHIADEFDPRRII